MISSAICLLILLSAISCSKAAKQTASDSPGTKRYHLKGKVVSVDKRAKMVNVDAEAIPDFMGAMPMPYTVNPESELDKLSPGDTITADVVVPPGDDGKYWLENIAVTQHSPSPASK